MSLPSSAGSLGNFDLVKHHVLKFGDVNLSKWRSRVTGLNVVHIDYDAPIVKGYFVVPTEIFNDSGCPHTLEHLVFMGSEKYPFKGVLDNLANRAFSDGTNAWTDVDHTCYTIATAGQEGFLRLLPIYIDHILYPTLSDEAFLTEVHHIDPKGGDSGVVYSEMQGRENTPGDLLNLRMSRLINPPESAYRSETGGLMKALRQLTVDQIRDYHHQYYVPYNLCLIVAGSVSSKELLQVLQNEVEASIIRHPHTRPENWKRPFVETSSANRIALTDMKKEIVEFPESDESAGDMLLNFTGSAPNDYLTATAIDVLAVYLTSSPIAPLNKEFIEIPSPLCTDIYIYESARATFSDIAIYATSVPTEKFQFFCDKLILALKRIAAEGVDMKRMEMILNRERRKFFSSLESSRGDIFSDVVISDYLYGKEDGIELPAAMDDIAFYDTLLTWSSKDWSDLLERYFISSCYASVAAKPSAQLAQKLESDEKARIDKQIAELGEAGLAEAGKKLEHAQEYNDRPIPIEFLRAFPLPNVASISWIPVQSALNSKSHTKSLDELKNQDLSKHIEKDASSFPLFLHYNNVKSDFVTVHAFLSTADVPDALKPYISVYLASFYSLPVVSKWRGRKLSHEEVISCLEDETVSYDANLGLEGYFTQLIRISIKVEVGKYEQAIEWLNDLLFRSEFCKDRLEVTVAKIQQSLPEAKRDGNAVVAALSEAMLFSSASSSRAGAVLELMDFIPRLAETLKSSSEEVITNLESLRQHLLEPAGIRFGVTGNVLSISLPKAPWAKTFTSSDTNDLKDVPLTYKALSTLGKEPHKQAVIMTHPSIESAYMIFSTRSIHGFDHPAFPVMRVTLEVLNATEGFLWRFIRGAGLAYGAYMGLDVEAGFLTFATYRSSNPLQAFQEARKVIQGLSEGTLTFDKTTLDSCKSAIVYSVTKRVSTPGAAALASFGNQVFRGVSQDHNVKLLDKYKCVTVEEVVDCIRTHFLPLFDPKKSVAAIVTGPSKAGNIADGLTSEGYEVEQREMSVDPMMDDDSGEEDGTEGSDGTEGTA